MLLSTMPSTIHANPRHTVSLHPGAACVPGHRPSQRSSVATLSHSPSAGDPSLFRQAGYPTEHPLGVFQLSTSTVPCRSILDVRDAVEACSYAATAEEKRKCYEVFGLDADKVDKYYNRVESMERLIDQGDSLAQRMVASGGCFMMWLIAVCILKV